MTKRDSDPSRQLHDHASTPETEVLHDMGFFGHFLYWHAGGRGGKNVILGRLLAHDGRLPQRELLERSHISSAALSEVLSKLEAKGLITRTRSEADRRQLDIVLTDEGAQTARQMLARKEAFEKDSLSVLTEDEKHELRELLKRVRDHWERQGYVGGETSCRNSSKA